MIKRKTITFRLYFLLYLLINMIYIGLELYKFKLRASFETNLQGDEYFHTLLGLGKVSIGLEYILTIFSIVFLVMALIYSKHETYNISLRKYILINIIFLIAFKGLGFILSKSLLITSGNLTQQNILMGYITLVALILYLFRTISRKRSEYRNII